MTTSQTFPASPVARLLIVDDQGLHMKALCDTLEQSGYETTGFTRPRDGLGALREQEFDLLLTDLMMPEMNGISLLQAAFEIDKALVGIVMTGHGTISSAVDAMKMGALDYILKPFKLRDVLPVISRALKVRRLRTENIQLLETVAIYELSMAIAFTHDRTTILRKMADAAFQQGDAKTVSILLPAHDGRELTVAAALGEDAERLEGERLPITYAISNWVARAEEVVLTPEGLDEVQPIPASAILESPNAVSIPMLAAGRLIGVLNFSPKRQNRPVPLGRIKTLNTLAGTAASALHATSLLEQLRTAEQRYRRLADNAPDVVFRYDLLPHRRCVYMSSAVTSLSGYSPEDFYADPDLALKIVHPDDRATLEAVLHGEPQEKTATIRWTPPNLPLRWIEQRNVIVQDKEGRTVAIEGIARDITERVNLEEQLRQSQRVEAVGRLAGGVAHDFNNMLTVINGYTDLILAGPIDAQIRTELEQVRKAGDKAAALTRQLLAFGRRQVLQPRVLNLNEVLEDDSRMLSRVLGEDIEVVTVQDPTLGKVKADRGQLDQVLMNLAVNSRDAMPKGGKLTIETRNAVLDDTFAQAHMDVKAGSYVVLIVSDTGTGMDADTRSRIFEPFFTTKELGRGTGLGLSIVYGIIKQSGGSIWVYSELGKGTTFKIYLPRTEESAEAKPPTPAKRTTGGSEVILLVEDDAEVRLLTRTILKRGGYAVLDAKDVHHARELLRTHDKEIGLVLTDLVLPETSGIMLAQELKAIRPEIKVLYTSGYSEDVIVRHGHLDAGMPFIQKPFGSADLLHKVRETLDIE